MMQFYKRCAYLCVITLIALFSLNSSFAQWTKLSADLPNLAYVGSGMSVIMNGKLYLFGGTAINPNGSGVYSNRAWSLDLSQNDAQWEEINSMPQPRIGGYAAAYNGKIYIVGGYYGNPAQYQNAVLEFDPVMNEYTEKAAITTPCYYVGGAALGSKIFVFGGISASGVLNKTQVYDIVTDTWEDYTAMKYSCAYAAATTVGSTIYVGGGFTTGVFQSVFYKGTVDGKTITWTKLSNLPIAIASAAAGSIGNNVFFAGGLANGSALNSTYKYDTQADKWTASFGLMVAPYYNNTLPSDGTSLYSVSGEGTGPSTYKFVEGPPAAIAILIPKKLEYTLRNTKTITRTFSLGNLGNIPLTGAVTIAGNSQWLTTQNEVSIDPNSLKPIEFTITPSGLEEKTYDGQIVISTNDNNQKELSVPVKLTVDNATTDRKPLLEVFSSSSCGPCRPGNENVKSVLSKYDESERVIVKYQQPYPRFAQTNGDGDPYTTDETYGRHNAYQINGIPHMRIDGGWAQNATSFTDEIYNDSKDVVATVLSNATYSVEGQKVKVSVDVKSLKNISKNNLKLFVAIYEKTTYQNVKTNGETEFHNVVKKMMPNHNGTAISSMVANESQVKTFEYEFPGEYRLPVDGGATNRIKLNAEHSVEDFNNLAVAVWIQEGVTGTVHNAENATIVSSVDELPDNSGLSFIDIYPNPSAGMTNFSFKAEKSMDVTLELFDLAGNKVASIFSGTVTPGEYSKQFDTSVLPSGQYNMWLKTNDKFIGRTINVVK